MFTASAVEPDSTERGSLVRTDQFVQQPSCQSLHRSFSWGGCFNSPPQPGAGRTRLHILGSGLQNAAERCRNAAERERCRTRTLQKRSYDVFS